MTRQMHLLAYVKTGPTAIHSGGWRHPEATLSDIFEPRRYEQIAQICEAARFDGVFFADRFGMGESPDLETFLRIGGQNSYLDPMLVLAIMARATSRIGLVATISTTFHSAYQLARSLGSLDLLSGGRAAWNVITSTNDLEARNAGMERMPPHDERYDRADEVLEACMALWDTWDPDPFVFDKESGVFVDPDKVHFANYEGRWTRTRGPLVAPGGPQGHPVIIQAGHSERGREFAVRWAEIVFGPNRDAHAYYQDMHKRLAATGRDPSSCKVLPGITPILGETEEIARARAEYLAALNYPEAEYDTSQRGDIVVGTASMVADRMQEMFESGECDGFIVEPVTFPTSLEQFCRSVVPELQRRGLFRTEYKAATLRENLGD